jgi:predicted O-linked N-acetylglucosamine transferase (SPINDLY family)
MSASDEERLIVDEIIAGLARGENDPWALHYRAAAIFYWRYHELEPWDPTRLPPWLFYDFMAWVLRQPFLFTDYGEVDLYQKRLREWMERVRQQLKTIPQNQIWRSLAEPMTIHPNLIGAYFTSADLLPLVRARSDIMEMYMRQSGCKLDMDPPPTPTRGKKIRVGILKNHWLAGTETYATLPLFQHLPRDRFEVILYVLEEARDQAEAHCKRQADRFVVLPQLDVNKQAELIRRDNCDILHYAINMNAVTHPLVPLALHRMAPVQLTSICSPATTGLLNMDYFLAGELTEPREDAQASYREKLIKLPGSGICFDYTVRPPPSAYAISREMLKVDDKTVVLTSGANYFKIIPELRRSWAKMLAAIPNTVLVLYPFGPAWTNNYPAGGFIRCFQEELRRHGVAFERVQMLQPMDSPTDVKKVMAMTDVYVDSFPYTGATSLLDPLEASVPPVTMTGDRLRFAQGDALLRELGMPELIATSEQDYIRIVSELAGNRERRERTRQTVREKMAAGPAFLDSQRFSANAAELFERLLKEAARSR